MEATLMPYRHRERQEIPLVGLVGGFWCLELCLYGIRELAEVSSTMEVNQAGEYCQTVTLVKKAKVQKTR